MEAVDLPAVFWDAIEEHWSIFVADSSAMSEQDRLDLIREHDVYLVCRHSDPAPRELAADPGRLRLIVAVVGSLRAYVPAEVIESEIPVANWGDGPAQEIAEGTLALLLAVLKDLHAHIRKKQEGGWKVDPDRHGGTIDGASIGLYGYGHIGARFAPMLVALGATVMVFDPFVEDLPQHYLRASSLEELFSNCPIISIHAGLTDETRHSVAAEHLALLPKYGVVINTARGGIVDQEALFAELERGRLRAGLDVLDESDELPPDHPARGWENCLLTSHQIFLRWPRDGAPPETLTTAQRYAIENLQRLVTGAPIVRQITPEAFGRMT